jgi:hypothetical protein
MPDTLDRPWFGREPALIIQGISTILAMLVGFGVPGLDDGLVAAIAAVLVAAAAVYTSLYVRPIQPTLFGGLIAALATLGAAFGLDLAQQQVALVTLAAQALVALLTRPQQKPVTISGEVISATTTEAV